MNKVYTKIESIVGNVITVRATGVKYNDLAMVGNSYANVIKLDGDLVSLQVFAGAQGVRTNDPVRFLGVPMRVSYSDNLMGRVFDGSGKPRDNGPELDENMVEIGGPSVNPAKRIVPKNLIRTGIPMIDVFNTLVQEPDPHRYPDDRCVQHTGREPEASDFLRLGRAVQRAFGTYSHAG